MFTQDVQRTKRAAPGTFGFWTGFALIALAFAVGAALTWRKWPDLIVDFGIQLYIPWQLSQGAVLYRDLFYMAGGPLSQYWHALLFKLFGPSFLVVIISNFTITALILFVVYREFGRLGGVLCGLLTTLAIICVFCFGQFIGVGNYNFAAPYSHEMLHGLALSIAAVALLAAWREQSKIVFAAVAGICAGLAALTKPDIFLALAVATLATFLWPPKPNRQFLIRSAAAFLAGAIAPPLAFFLFFLRTGGWQESLRLEFFGWRPLFIPGVVSSPYYQWSLGMDDPFVHLHTIALYTLIIAAVIAICAWLMRMAQSLAPLSRWPIQLATALLLLIAARRINWSEAGAVLPAICLVLLALLWRRTQKDRPNMTAFFPVIWTIFALFLLAKQGLHPRLWQTGFTLAMPAFACAIFLLGWELPAFLEERFSVPARPMRLFALAVMFVGIAGLVQTCRTFYQAKHLPVGHGSDIIIARGPAGNAVEARTMNQALAWIETNMPAGASLAAIPEGTMLNYLSRHANSTPCLDWNPVMLAVYGATNMDAALQKHPPDYIALVEWQPYEFNEMEFGATNYGGATLAWIRENYRPQALFGGEPLRNGVFGIKLLKHSTPPEDSVSR